MEVQADKDLIEMWDKASARDARGKRNAKKTAPTEHALQVGCVRWYRETYPQWWDLLIAIPNGGKRNIGVARKLQAEGVIAGVPDLFLAIPAGRFHGLFLELKNGKSNDTTANQRRVMLNLSLQLYKTEVVRTHEEFVKKIQEYLQPLTKSCNFATGNET